MKCLDRLLACYCSLSSSSSSSWPRRPRSTWSFDMQHFSKRHSKLFQKSAGSFNYYHVSTTLAAQPKKGSAIEHYQTVSVNCQSCGERLFRYKKKNGTKSNLVKCYQERIVDDEYRARLLQKQQPFQPPPSQDSTTATPENTIDENDDSSTSIEQWKCPSCQTPFARSSMIHGRPALKLIGGKVRMSKK